MQKRRFIILILILIIIIAVVIVLVLNKKSTDQLEQNVVQQEEIQVDLEKITKEYQIQLEKITENYVLLDASVAAEDYDLKLENIKSTLDKLMNLTLTKEFKESHLELVVALDSLQNAYHDQDAILIKQAEDKMNEVISNL